MLDVGDTRSHLETKLFEDVFKEAAQMKRFEHEYVMRLIGVSLDQDWFEHSTLIKISLNLIFNLIYADVFVVSLNYHGKKDKASDYSLE